MYIEDEVLAYLGYLWVFEESGYSEPDLGLLFWTVPVSTGSDEGNGDCFVVKREADTGNLQVIDFDIEGDCSLVLTCAKKCQRLTVCGLNFDVIVGEFVVGCCRYSVGFFDVVYYQVSVGEDVLRRQDRGWVEGPDNEALRHTEGRFQDRAAPLGDAHPPGEGGKGNGTHSDDRGVWVTKSEFLLEERDILLSSGGELPGLSVVVGG